MRIKLSLLICSLVLLGCATRSIDKPAESRSLHGVTLSDTLDLSALRLGTEIGSTGELLMSLPQGFIRLERSDHDHDSVLVVAVHGYESRGYEWVAALHGLTEYFGASFFFQYDWERCPQDVAKDLASQLQSLLALNSTVRQLLLFSHSYGGIVTTFSLAEINTQVPAEIHIIAAPLAGYPRLLDNCPDLEYSNTDEIVYPVWNPQLKVIQHRTAHEQDGAFRDLAIDPQVVELPFTRVERLPPTMDGHRLGHNWSVSWVVDTYLGKAHRY